MEVPEVGRTGCIAPTILFAPRQGPEAALAAVAFVQGPGHSELRGPRGEDAVPLRGLGLLRGAASGRGFGGRFGALGAWGDKENFDGLTPESSPACSSGGLPGFSGDSDHFWREQTPRPYLFTRGALGCGGLGCGALAGSEGAWGGEGEGRGQPG